MALPPDETGALGPSRTFSEPSATRHALGARLNWRRLQRVRQVNYGVVCMGSIVAGLVLNPASLVWMALLACAWVYMFMVRGSTPLVVNGHEVTPQQKLYGMGAFSGAAAQGSSRRQSMPAGACK